MKLELEENEVNYILQSLGLRPFMDVFQLIGKIQKQGQEQIAPPAAE